MKLLMIPVPTFDNRSNKLSVEQYKAFIEDLAKSKKVELAEMKNKMAHCGPPGFTGTSNVCLQYQYKITENIA